MSKTPEKAPNPELFFQKSFFLSSLSNPEELSLKFQQLIFYLVDVDESQFSSLEAQKPFHFLFETLSQAKFLQETSISLLLSNVFIQLMRLLNKELKLAKENISIIFNFLKETLRNAINCEEIQITQLYFLFETIEKAEILELFKDPIFSENLGDFIRIFFESEVLLEKEPEISNIFIDILTEILIKDTFSEEIHRKIYENFLFSLLCKKNHQINYQNMGILLSRISQKTKKNLSKFILEAFQGKILIKTSLFSQKKTLKFEEILIIMKEIFKFDGEMLLDAIKYVESSFSDAKISENHKNACFLFIGKLFKEKNSRISVIFPRLFKEFSSQFHDKKYMKIRYDLLKILIKYLINHHEKREISAINSSFSEVKFKENLLLVENALISFILYEKDWTNKHFIFKSLGENCEEFPKLFSHTFYKSLFSAILIVKDPVLKENLYQFLCGLYDNFVVKLFRKGVFSLNSSEFSLENGEIREYNGNEKEIAREFAWFLGEFFRNSFRIQKSESVFLIKAFNELLFCKKSANLKEKPKKSEEKLRISSEIPINSEENSIISSEKSNEKSNEKTNEKTNEKSNEKTNEKSNEKTNEKTEISSLSHLWGIQYFIEEKTLAEGLLIDSNEKIYQKFIYKILGLKWRVFYENLQSFEAIIYKKAWERALKLREKISFLAKKRFLEENTKENRDFLEFKLKKYCSNIDEIPLKKVVISLEKALESDENTRNFIRDLAENDDNKRKFALDFLVKKIKEENTAILLKTWFHQEFPIKDEENIAILEEITIKLKSFINEKDFLLIFSGLELLLTIKKAFKLNFSARIAEISYDFLKKLEINAIFEEKTLEEAKKKREFLDILTTKTLKILFYCRINKNFPFKSSPEEYKAFFIEKLKKCLKANQCKWLILLINQLDEITSTKNLKPFFLDSLQKINENSAFLCKNLRIIRTFIEETLPQEKIGVFLNKKHENLFEIATKIIEKTDENGDKGFIISELAIGKRDLLKILHYLLFKKEKEDNLEDFYQRESENYKELLLAILLKKTLKNKEKSFNHDFLRVQALSSFFEVFSMKNQRKILDASTFVRVSMLCFDENVEIRKILFNFLIKFTSGREKYLETPFLALIFMFLLDSEKNLAFLCRNITEKLIEIVDKKTKKILEKNAKIEGKTSKTEEILENREEIRENREEMKEKVSLNREEMRENREEMREKVSLEKCIENSVEYCLVYLIPIIVKNPFFKEKSHLNFNLISAFFDDFFSLFEKNAEKEKSAIFFTEILKGLSEKNTKEFDCGNAIEFFISKNIKGKAGKELEEKVFGLKEEDYYDFLIEMLKKIVEKKLGFCKNLKIYLKIDENFYENRRKSQKKLEEFKDDIKEFVQKFKEKSSKKAKEKKETPKKIKKKPEKSKKKDIEKAALASKKSKFSEK